MNQLNKIQIIEKNLEESWKIKNLLLNSYLSTIVEIADKIAKVIRDGNKIWIFGNGGSAADSQHIAAEFTGRYQNERRPLPAIALTTNSSEITAIGNDYGYEYTFSRPLRAAGVKGDLAWGITTSGNSLNVIRAIEVAKACGLWTFVLTGNKGGNIKGLADYEIIVPAEKTNFIQEAHIQVYHNICELVELEFLNEK